MNINQKIEDIFNEWDDSEDFSGVISISNSSAIVYEKVQGFRNRGEKLPNKRDTAFGTASGTKLFTAAAICQLIDQGKLTPGSKVWDILPQDLKTIDKAITVFHLLTHSSGIADYLDFEDRENKELFYDKHPVNKWTSNEFYLPLFNELPCKFKPGTKADYSNSNFILLGLIIEAVTKESYHTYMGENVFKPLGLTGTGFYATNNLPANTAVGYIWDRKLDEYVGNYFHLPVVGAADGGLYTTANDMALFWSSVFEGKMFSQSILEKFLAPHTVFEDIDGHFGLGVFVSDKEGDKVYWHDGGDYGVNFCTAYCPGTGNILTILSNVGVNLLEFSEELIRLIASRADR